MNLFDFALKEYQMIDAKANTYFSYLYFVLIGLTQPSTKSCAEVHSIGQLICYNDLRNDLRNAGGHWHGTSREHHV